MKILDILFVGLIGVAVGMLIALSTSSDADIQTEKVVTECEKELPRHLHCEPVYSARVVEENQ